MDKAAIAGLTALAAMYIDAKTFLVSDLHALYTRVRATKATMDLVKHLGMDNANVWKILESADESAVALYFEGREWTYGELKNETSRLADFLYSLGIREKQIVAVCMDNSPELVFTMFACFKVGCAPALLNATLHGDSLEHVLNISTATTVLTTHATAKQVSEVLPKIGRNIKPFVLDYGSYEAQNTRFDVVKGSELRPTASLPYPGKLSFADPGVLLYTSGTTGRPKAIQLHTAFLHVIGHPLGLMRITPDDRIYSVLPLYHGTAMIGLMSALNNGATLCLGRKFSASNFWKEAKVSRANRMMYIGELCRYLVAQPVSPHDKDHFITYAFGNGLRKSVWTQFRDRFGIHTVHEFMAATDGVGAFENKNTGEFGVGAVGHRGWLLRAVPSPIKFIKHDVEIGQPWRDPKTGLCKLADVNEPGEMVAEVTIPSMHRPYFGDKKATEAKFIHDVLKKGDRYNRMGDLLMMDSDGLIWFSDRIGDTFRAKGENVATSDIERQVSTIPQVSDATVYGIPLRERGYDGQVGMLAMSLKQESDEQKVMTNLASHLRKGLPSYAVPRFVRIMKEINITATFKHQKNVLRKQAFDNVGGDTVYWLPDERSATYVKMTKEALGSIARGEARL